MDWILKAEGMTMRLQVSKTKNAASFYVVKSVYENKRHSSRIVEKLGTYNDLPTLTHGQR